MMRNVRECRAAVIAAITAKVHHFAIAAVATVLSIRANGPCAMTYVNAADDPRKAK